MAKTYTVDELTKTLGGLKVGDEGKMSLMAEFLTKNKDKLDELMKRKTKLGGTLVDCVQSGIAVPTSKIGLYACDPEAYTVFGDMMEYVLRQHCKIPEGLDTPSKQSSWDAIHPSAQLADVAKKYVVSTRIRVARNVEGFPFPAMINKEQRLELESQVSAALKTLEGEHKGTYHSLKDLSKEQQKELVDSHVLYKDDDQCLETCGAYRDWPSGRGIFFNEDKTFIVWVNEEDHMRIICLKMGALLEECFDFLKGAQAVLGEKLNFAATPKFGNLAFCPTNLGTGMRLSVHIKLKEVQKLSIFKSICANMNLDIRGIHGEHTESEGGVFDISNKIRFGMTEREILNQVLTGVNVLSYLENELNKSA